MLALAIREGLRNVRRHRALSLVLSGSIGLGLVLAAFLAALGQAITQRLAAWESRVELVAFVPAETAPAELARIRAALEALPEVTALAYTSPEEGWRQLIQGVEAADDLVSAAEVGLVPGAFTLRLRRGAVELEDLERLARECASVPGVAEVEYAADLLTRYAALRQDLRRVIRLGLLLLMVLLAGLSAGTIQLGLNARRGEVRSWVWEGAQPAFLSVVCATEAALQGLLGSGWAVCAYVLGERLAVTRWGFTPPSHWPLFTLILVLGPALGVVASLLSTRRLIRALGLSVVVLVAAWPTSARASEEPGEPDSGPLTTQEFDAQRMRDDLDRLREQRELALQEARRLGGESISLLGEIEQLGVIQDTLHNRMANLRLESEQLRIESAALHVQIRETEEAHRSQGDRVVALSRLLERAPEPTALSVLLADRPHGETIRRARVRDALLRHRLEAFGELERAQRVLRNQRHALDGAHAESEALAAELAANVAAQEAARTERRALLQTVQAEQAIAAATAAEAQASMGELEGLLRDLPAGVDPARAFYGPVPFPELRGVLPRPVEHAKVARGFGRHVAPVFLTVTRHDGWLLTPEAGGAPVLAVHDGRVRYLGWLHGYGRLLVLDHGGGYQTVYGHCADFFVEPGQVVRAGDLVATVGRTGPLATPALYFAVRVQGKAADPAVWLEGTER